MTKTINITGLDKAEVLAALFNASHQQGMGFVDRRGAQHITVEDARLILKEHLGMDFDYLYGRVMKVNLATDDLDPQWYDRDNGVGAAARALKPLMNGG